MIYLSGAISDADRIRQKNNVSLFDCVQRRLERLGNEVHNPASFERPDWTWEEYLAHDLLWIARHKPHLYMLPGWQASRGARLEFEFAKALGLMIIEEKHNQVIIHNPSR